MRRIMGALLIFGLCVSQAVAQVPVNVQINLTGDIDFTTAVKTLPVKAGTTAATPSTCTPNKELYIKTDATDGQQLFICNDAGNGYNLVGDGAAGGLTVEEIDTSPTGTPTTLRFTNGSVTDEGGGVFTIDVGAGGGGDVSGPGSSTDGGIALFDGTGGTVLKQATGSGLVTTTSGVYGTVTAPSGTVVGTSDTQTLTNKTLTTPTIASFTNATHTHTNAAGGGQITDAALSSAVTVPKGGTGATTLTGVVLGNGTSAMTAATSSTVGQVLRVETGPTIAFGALDLADTDAVTGTLANVRTTAASANTASAIVARDGSGNFSAGTITAALTGNASTATALAANGANCSAGQAPLGVDASGAVEGCFTPSGSGDVAKVGTPVDNQVGVWTGNGTIEGVAALTYSAGTLAVGEATATLGKVTLSGNTSGTITIQPQAAAGTFNFNLPTTAGSSGTVLTSGGGSGTAMTWTTLAASATTDTTSATNITSGTLPIARIADDAVTYAKIQNVSATDRLLGRDTSGAGDIEEITPANVKTMLAITCSELADDGSGCSSTVGAGTSGRVTYYTGTQAVDDSTAVTLDGTDILTKKDKVTAVSASTTLGAHNVVYVTTSTTDRTMTLPAASSATVGKYLIIKADNASGDVLLAPNGSDTLNGVNGTTGITNQYESMEVTLVSSTEWQVIKTVTGIDGANLAAGSVAAAALAGFTIAELNTLVSDANLVVDPGSNGLVNRTAATTASAITSTTVGQTLRVTGSNAFAFGALDLADTDAVTGILPGANGGTGNGFFAVSGPATSLKTFTFPNASSTVLTSNAAVTIAQGGTGTGSTLTGVLLGSGSAFTAVTSTTVGQVLRVTGSNTFAFGALDLADTDAVTGVLPVGNLPSNLALLDATNTWSDGVKQTFNPNATNAGVNVGSHAGDPSSPANGDLWYDSSANELTARINGANVALGAGGGGGTPGGSDTQVQFNNSSSFGGSANLTWVSPALTIGVEASASGTLNLANGNATGDTVTIQNISTTAGDWNFNLPATAGSSGQVLTSAAGGSSPMTWTTLAASATTDTTNASNISSGTLSEARFPDASDTVRGDVELATAAETTTGTDTGRAVTPDGLAGSDFGKRYITVECVADATALTTGDGKCYFPIHPDLNGWLVVDASAHVGAAVSSSGAVDVDIDVCGAVATGIRCSGTNRDLLSTNITIDANEDGTETATAETINTSNDDLATGEWLRFNIDGAGTGTQGLYVTVVLQKP